MRICVGSDEELLAVGAITDHLEELGHVVTREAVGANWVEVGHKVGQLVARGEAEFGIVCCTTGTGVSIATNKVNGVRAALCRDVETAIGARKWNDANVLALSLRSTTPAEAGAIAEAFVSAEPDHDELVVIGELERLP